MRVSVDVQTEYAEIAALLERMSARQIAKSLESVGEGLVNETRKTFKTGIDPYGKPWQKLAASTLSKTVRAGRKRSQYYGGKPLLRLGFSGGMAGSANHQMVGGSLEVGLSKPYAVYHQGDNPAHPGKGIVPQRRILPTDPTRPLPRAWQQTIINGLESESKAGCCDRSHKQCRQCSRQSRQRWNPIANPAF